MPVQPTSRAARGPALLLGAALALAACGSSPQPEAAQPAQSSSGAEMRAPREGMQVSGLYGTISTHKVELALEPKFPKFARCFADGASRVEQIAGGMKFYFRVGLDGRVEWVYPRESSVGDRPTEQCLLEVARATRFPAPQGGGAAEVTWSFEIDGSEDIRPPLAWQAEKVQDAVAHNRDAIASCGQGAFSITTYVGPGGQVLAAGAAADSADAAARIDCVVEAVKAWSMPDPGSYPAKVTFSAP
jgi:hypothetical protein